MPPRTDDEMDLWRESVEDALGQSRQKALEVGCRCAVQPRVVSMPKVYPIRVHADHNPYCPVVVAARAKRN